MGQAGTGTAFGAFSGAPRAMAGAVDAALAAARGGDADAFADATASLERVDREQLAVLLGTMTQHLLERALPDGLDSDDVQQLLADCARDSGWFEAFDADALVRALVGTLGLTDVDEAPQMAAAAVVAHGLLLVAELLAVARADRAEVIVHAMGELHRAQTMEMP